MSKHLQISLQANLDSDPEPEINLTPVDTAIGDGLASSLEEAIVIADLSDADPLSGALEVDTKVDYPLKIMGRTFYIKLPVRLKLKLVDKPQS